MSEYLEHLKVIRKHEVIELFGFSATSLHRQIKSGIFPSSFSLGCRAVGWYHHEVVAVIKARAAGKGDEEIRKLVQKQIEIRQSSEYI